MTRTTIARLGNLLTGAALLAACRDPAGLATPGRRELGAPSFAVAGAHPMTLDQVNGQTSATGTAILKGFNPVNPQNGDAIIATFFWTGSATITSVTDHETNGRPVGNTYTLVDVVSAGGLTMATYVALNVRNFPGGFDERVSSGDSILVVRANMSAPIASGGVMISAYRGVTVGLGAHRSGSGSGSSVTPAAPGTIPVAAGALVYGVTLANQVAGLEPPAAPFANVSNQSDGALTMKVDGEYAVQASAGSVDPQWLWFFNSQSDWMSTVVALNPVATNLVIRTQPATTLPLATIPAVRVAVEDDLGNTMTSFNGTVTIAIGHNGGLVVPGTLSGTKTVAVTNGVATFSDLSIDQPGNGYTLRVSASNLVGAESAAFNIGAL